MSKESRPTLASSIPARYLSGASALLACALLVLTAAPAAAQSEEEQTPPAVTPPEGEADIFSYSDPSSDGAAATGRIDGGAAATGAAAGGPRIERARLVGKPGHRWNRGTRRVIADAARAE
ncbi:MAG: hypothetical protein AAGF23_00600, partial [Acidobacteriota bacterium]